MTKEQEIELLKTFLEWKHPYGINIETYNDGELEQYSTDVWILSQRGYLDYTTIASTPVILNGVGKVATFFPDIQFFTTEKGYQRLNQLQGIKEIMKTEPQTKINQWSVFGTQQVAGRDSSWKQESSKSIWSNILEFIKSLFGK